jgi:hypothetical protein
MLLPFELDPQIIHHIIYSQAGSLGKALIELLMNSVDAQATAVQLTITKEGFECCDDGSGFASREDVIRYFGRFGTPHAEGDATYGRFRLGRGQIMAHASTIWHSNRWKMTVDTRSTGYSYDLEDLADAAPGCRIGGLWYEPLSDAEMMSAVQEVRDLVRYTPIKVDLNGRTITRDPRTERWDFEDEHAYYRVKAEGAVSIYNQGVLVRHDSSHEWGAGGLVVSKNAIGLNVSRTEILRKTCPVWKPIAKQFAKMAEELAAKLGDHRKTEARREKCARALLSGDPEIRKIYDKEEVITVLPGKRHITLSKFLRDAHYDGKIRPAVTVVEDGFDIPKGEAIAREGIAQVVHPQTLSRFGCFNPEDFREAIERIVENIQKASEGLDFWGRQFLHTPVLADFATLKEAFTERTRIVTEKDALDKETRRAWVALRWCIQQYAGVCLGGRRYTNGRLVYDDPHKLSIFIGESNKAEAWTDGKTYLAIDIRVVKRLKQEPLKTVGYIFGLVEHEVAHNGDSLECGHDEAFYQRHHDISLRMAGERQRHIHIWLQKYTYSMDREGKKPTGQGWYERVLADRAGMGRQKRGLPRLIGGVEDDPLVKTPVPDENLAQINFINAHLTLSGLCPPPPDWNEVAERARLVQAAAAEQQKNEAVEWRRDEGEEREHVAMNDAAWAEYMDELREKFAKVLGIPPSDIADDVFECMYQNRGDCDDDVLRQIWADKESWIGSPENSEEIAAASDAEGSASQDDPREQLEAGFWHLLHEGETWWGLQRNAAAAGFYRADEYLTWRAENQA